MPISSWLLPSKSATLSPDAASTARFTKRWRRSRSIIAMSRRLAAPRHGRERGPDALALVRRPQREPVGARAGGRPEAHLEEDLLVVRLGARAAGLEPLGVEHERARGQGAASDSGQGLETLRGVLHDPTPLAPKASERHRHFRETRNIRSNHLPIMR